VTSISSGFWICPGCGTHIAPLLLACPTCHRLVHGDALARLADEAKRQESANNVTEALRLWREALDLLPPGTQQHTIVSQKVIALSRAIDAAGGQRSSASSDGKKLGVRAAAAAAIIFVLSKAKLLLLGLSKSGTIISMLLSFGVYWAAFGWPLAAGLVVSIYIHEMGHVAMLTRYGFKASVPMFIPGLGAVIRLKQIPVDPREDARIGLAGPIWGAGAAIAAYALGLYFHQPIFLAIAKLGAWINLFNLVPFWQLDGGRGFRPLSRLQAWLLIAIIFGIWFPTHEGLLILIGGISVFRALAIPPNSKESDLVAFIQFASLIVGLTLMSKIRVPGFEI
jgi:Zn-dependent protease